MAAHTTTTNATSLPSADSLERSLRSFSIHDSRRYRTNATRHVQKSESDSECRQKDLITLDLNSETSSLPYNWEQCLDLKTGEIYFINRSNGVKTKEDPREMLEYRSMYYYSDDEDDEEDENGDDGSCEYETDDEVCRSNVVKGGETGGGANDENVLVAAGCRSCLMYYMVPKQVNDCPKCKLNLLHFDRLEKSSSSSPATV